MAQHDMGSYLGTYIYIYICMSTHAYTQMYIYICDHMHNIFVYTHIHTPIGQAQASEPTEQATIPGVSPADLDRVAPDCRATDLSGFVVLLMIETLHDCRYQNPGNYASMVYTG